jgi:hypothetical protein
MVAGYFMSERPKDLVCALDERAPALQLSKPVWRPAGALNDHKGCRSIAVLPYQRRGKSAVVSRFHPSLKLFEIGRFQPWAGRPLRRAQLHAIV